MFGAEWKKKQKEYFIIMSSTHTTPHKIALKVKKNFNLMLRLHMYICTLYIKIPSTHFKALCYICRDLSRERWLKAELFFFNCFSSPIQDYTFMWQNSSSKVEVGHLYVYIMLILHVTQLFAFIRRMLYLIYKMRYSQYPGNHKIITEKSLSKLVIL